MVQVRPRSIRLAVMLFVTKMAAFKFLKKAMKKQGRAGVFVTDKERLINALGFAEMAT